MIDLTPLDVRKKKGDFSRGLRGYDPDVVDGFLDLVADRLEELVRENVMLKERTSNLTDTVASFRQREQAMNEALVSAQQLREEFRAQAERDAELILREARAKSDQIRSEADRQAAAVIDGIKRLEGQRSRYIRSFRAFVERQLSEIELEEERAKEAQAARAEQEAAAENGAQPAATASASEGQPAQTAAQSSLFASAAPAPAPAAQPVRGAHSPPDAPAGQVGQTARPAGSAGDAGALEVASDATEDGGAPAAKPKRASKDVGPAKVDAGD